MPSAALEAGSAGERGVTWDPDERPAVRVCAVCARGWHHECWGPTPSRWRAGFCGCECHGDEDEEAEA